MAGRGQGETHFSEVGGGGSKRRFRVKFKCPEMKEGEGITDTTLRKGRWRDRSQGDDIAKGEGMEDRDQGYSSFFSGRGGDKLSAGYVVKGGDASVLSFIGLLNELGLGVV